MELQVVKCKKRVTSQKLYKRKVSIILLIIIALFVTEMNGYGQTVVTLGSGTSTSTTAGLVPIRVANRDSRSQYLIRASELSSLDEGERNITGLAIYVSHQPGIDIANFSIGIKHTSSTALNTTWDSDFTNVYSRSSQSRTPLTTDNWRYFIFDNYFQWNGTDNIIIQICFDNSSTNSSGGVLYNTPFSGNHMSRHAVDNTGGAVNGCTMTPSASNTNFRPQFQLQFCENTTVSTFPHSQNFSSESLPDCWTITDNTGSGRTWVFGSHEDGISGGEYAYVNSWGANTNSELITNIFNFTDKENVTLKFKHFVEWSSCVASVHYKIGNGSWVEIDSWNEETGTAFDPEQFNQTILALAGEPVVRFKWSFVANNQYSWNIDDIEITATALSTCDAPTSPASSSVTYNSATISWTAPVEIPADGYEYYLSSSSTAPTSGTTATGTASGTSKELTGLTQNTQYYFWVRSVCDATEPTKSDWTSSGTFTTLNCASPSNLGSSSITYNSTTISWTAASPVPTDGYQYYYSTSSTAPDGGTSPSGSTNSSTTSASLSGLSAATQYYFWVRSVCDNGSSVRSSWVGSATFTTDELPPKTSTLSAGAGAEPATISSLINTEGAASLNFDFTFLDDGATPATDNDPTQISQIVFKQGTGNDISNWTHAIAGAKLSDGTNSTTTATINETNITFSSISNSSGQLGYIADNASKTYTLSIWLKTELGGTLPANIDGKNFVYLVDNSSFTFTEGGLVVDQSVNSGSDKNEVTVTATKLIFDDAKPPASTNCGTNFNVKALAIDANGNTDTDATTSVTIQRASGNGILSSATGLTQSLSSGVYEWTDVQYNTADFFSIETSSTLTDATSISITNNTNAPTAPNSLPGEVLSETSFLAKWESVAGADSYRLDVSTASDFSTYLSGLENLNVGAVTQHTISGISAGTYYYRVRAVSNCGTSLNSSTRTVVVTHVFTGNYTVGSGGDFFTLTGNGGLFEAINSGSLSGNVTAKIVSDITEPGIHALNHWSESGAGNYTLSIVPDGTTQRILSGTVTGNSMIKINGADRVIFDGRFDGSGKYLTFRNTNATPANAEATIEFTNGSQNCEVKYCLLENNIDKIENGTISVTSGTNSVTITNNNIRNSTGGTVGRPANAVFINSANNTVTISNNNIFNFQRNGIRVDNVASGATISGNNIYQTDSYDGSTSIIAFGIYLKEADNHVVANNYIGGSEPESGGSAWTINNTVDYRFVGIHLNVGTGTATSVQNNTISNFSWRTSASSQNSFIGIEIFAGRVDVGTISGNTIGGSSTNNITVATSNTSTAIGISSSSTSTVHISNNTISGLSIAGTVAATASHLIGIKTVGASGNYTISNNTIGNTSTANSLRSGISGTTTGATSVIGIENTATGTINITSNTIANLSSWGVNTSSNIRGISCVRNSTITLNTIRNLQTASSGTNKTSTASAIGILINTSTAGVTISQNTIYDISNTHTTASIGVIGIYYNGATSGTNLIERNLVHGLNVSTTSATAEMSGIYHAVGNGLVNNNMVRLGINKDGNSITSPCIIHGIILETASYITGLYHNSVYIGGQNVGTSGGTDGNSFALRSKTSIVNTRTYQNNIFVNARSNASSGGKHYAIKLATGGTTTLDYNIYQAIGNGAVFGRLNSTDQATFSAWKTASSQDANSYYSDPLFENPTGATPDLRIKNDIPYFSDGDAKGTNIASVTVDFFGNTRSNLTPVDIGAHAFKQNCVDAPTVGNLTVCENERATIAPTGPDNPYRFYADNSGSPGALLYTGETYTTPVLGAGQDRSYWVSSVYLDEANVGPASNSIGAGGMWTTADYVEFNVTNPNGVIIKSVDVYFGASTGTNFTIQVRQSPYGVGNVVASYSGDVETTNPNKQTVPVYLSIPQGNNYRMMYSSGVQSHRNTSGAVFPYTIADVISITGGSSSGSGYYYYFYNWDVGKVMCESEKVKVDVSVNTIYPAEVSVTPETADGICENSPLAFTATCITTGVDYSWQYSTIGSSIWSDVANEFTDELNFSNISQTWHDRKIRSKVTKEGCSKFSNSVDITVKPIPTNISVSDDASICLGASVQLSGSGNGNYQANKTAFSEDFDGVVGTLPSAWQCDNFNCYWAGYDDSEAGGTSPELMFYTDASSTIDDYRVISPLIDGRDFQNLSLTFKHMVDLWSGSFTIKVETSTDGSNWTSRWSTTVNADIASTTVNLNLNTLVGNQFYLAFTYSGNPANGNGWYIDNILLKGDYGYNVSYSWSPSTGLSNAAIANPLATPTSTTDYTLSVNLNGCTAEENVTITVNQPTANGLSNGDYLWSGQECNTWNNCQNWLVYNASNYHVASAIPDANKNVFIKADDCVQNYPHVITSAEVKNVFIENGKSLIVQENQILNVKGDWVNNGGFTTQTNSKVIFDGNTQQTIKSNNSEFFKMEVNKANGTILLEDNLVVKNELILREGIINTADNKLIVGTSVSDKGSINHQSGMILGIVERWFSGTNSGNASGLIPLGVGNNERFVTVEYSGAPTSGGTLTTTWIDEPMGTAGLPISVTPSGSCDPFVIQNTTHAGYWKIDEGNGLSGGTYNITLIADGIGGVTEICQLAPLKRVGAGDWQLAGSYVQPTGTNSKPIAKANTVSGWSNWGIGGGELNPLPVALLYFNAICNSNNEVHLKWATASESNADYFEIQKSTDAIHWKNHTRVPCAGFSNTLQKYEAIDSEIYKYYRLMQYDFDGTAHSSAITSTNCDNADFSVQYHYQTGADFINLWITSAENGQIIIEISDVNGKTISKQIQGYHANTDVININLSNLSKALYFIRVIELKQGYVNVYKLSRF